MASVALPRGAWWRGGDVSSLFSARQAKEEHVTPAFGAAVLPRHSHGHHEHKRLWLKVSRLRCNYSQETIRTGLGYLRHLPRLPRASASVAAGNDLTSSRGLPAQTGTATLKHHSHLRGLSGRNKLLAESCVWQSGVEGRVLTQAKLLALPTSVPALRSPFFPSDGCLLF